MPCRARAVVQDDLAGAGGRLHDDRPAPAVVAGVAVENVMLPVCWPSPIVTVPVEVVKIWASSAVVRLMPATGVLFVPPICIGRDSTDD